MKQEAGVGRNNANTRSEILRFRNQPPCSLLSPSPQRIKIVNDGTDKMMKWSPLNNEALYSREVNTKLELARALPAQN